MKEQRPRFIQFVACRRPGLTLLALLVVALSLLSTCPLRPALAHAASAAISLTPISGKPNTTVHVTGYGFGASEPVSLTMGSTPLVSTTSNAQGHIAAAFQVPYIAPGTYAVTAMGQQSQLSASAPFIIPPFTSITLSLTGVAPGGLLPIKGIGFLPGERVQLTLGGIPGLQPQASSSGTFTGNLPVPITTPAGTYSVQATGEQSGFSASATVQVQTLFPWSSFGYDAQHDRANPYENTLSPTTVSGLAPLWRFSTSTNIDSSPAVSGGVVYIGSADRRLYALNASTGKKLWSFATGYTVESSPAVASGVVYVGSDDNHVYAFKASTGRLLWGFDTGSFVFSSPVVVNGVVYVGSADGKVYALDASSGTQLWNYATGSLVLSSPAVVNGVVYVGSFDGKVYALDASHNGALLWRYATGYIVFSSPAVANGVVYVGSEDGNVYALDASMGTRLWSFAPPYGIDPIDSSPAVANGVVYVGASDNHVYALDASTGAQLWSFSTGTGIDSSPAVANGVVYIGSGDRKVYALDASTGAKLWSYATASNIDSSAAVVNGVVYIGSEDGNVYAFSLPGINTVAAH